MQYNITYREKDGSWQYIISYKDSNGKWKQKSKQGFEKNRKGKQEAKDAAEKALEEIKSHLELNTPKEFEGITFVKFANEYLRHTKLYREYKTVQSTQTVVNKFSGLNNIELSKITTLDIQKEVDKFALEGLNPNTIKYYLKKLSIIFNAAKNQYQLINNVPTKNVQVNEHKDTSKKALTENEVKKLIDSFKNSSYYLIIFIAAKTGMRIGEILGLIWNDIDSKNNIITVNRQWKKDKKGDYAFGPLKSNNSYRKIPISKATTTELIKYKTVINIDTRIFNIINKDSTITYVNRLIKQYGFPISIHELRHTYATKLIANGMDFKTVASILGDNVQQVIKTYSHVNNDMMNRASALIENIF